MFETVHATVTTPVQLKVGRDPCILAKLYIIVFLSWANDNEEAYKLGGISMQNRDCPCRFCTVSRNEMHTSSQRLCPNNLRDANLAKALTDKCQAVFIKEMRRPLQTRLNRYFTVDELQILQDCKDQGYKLGSNCCHELFEYVQSRRITNLFIAQVPDLMHTCLKGIIEQNFRFGMTNVWLWNRKSNACLAKLDIRMKNAFINQAIQPFSKKIPFPKGVSHFFKKTRSSPGGIEKSSMSGGGLESQSTGDLLFWFMFAVGTRGAIVPNTIVPIMRNGRQVARINPTEVILNACSSAIEMLWCVRCEEMHEDNLHDLQYIVNVSNTHLMRNFYMKQVLANSLKMMLAVKDHIWAHSPMIRGLIGPATENDTNSFEHGHVGDKEAYKLTSKRLDSVFQEMQKIVSFSTSY